MSLLSNILFLDIETVSQTKDFESLPERLQEHWKKKAKRLNDQEPPEDLYFEKAAIYAEFGRVLCIGLGAFFENDEKFKVRTLYSDNESELLKDFKKVLEKHAAGKNIVLCAHNGKEFDFPYLCRRMLINGISLPYALDISRKKPWEIPHIDTLEMWKFGDYKNFTSLDLLASIFNIPGSKSKMDGSEVNTEFYLKENIEAIKEYCKEDVVVLAQLYLKLTGKNLIGEEAIVRI